MGDGSWVRRQSIHHFPGTLAPITQPQHPSPNTHYPSVSVTKWLEPLLAALVTLLGIGLTSVGALMDAHAAFAPGALLVLVGGGWLGNALARGDIRLFPRTP